MIEYHGNGVHILPCFGLDARESVTWYLEIAVKKTHVVNSNALFEDVNELLQVPVVLDHYANYYPLGVDGSNSRPRNCNRNKYYIIYISIRAFRPPPSPSFYQIISTW
jgi:hypothetical protein